MLLKTHDPFFCMFYRKSKRWPWNLDFTEEIKMKSENERLALYSGCDAVLCWPTGKPLWKTTLSQIFRIWSSSVALGCVIDFLYLKVSAVILTLIGRSENKDTYILTTFSEIRRFMDVLGAVCHRCTLFRLWKALCYPNICDLVKKSFL